MRLLKVGRAVAPPARRDEDDNVVFLTRHEPALFERFGAPNVDVAAEAVLLLEGDERLTSIGDFSSSSSGNRSVIHEVGETLTGGLGFMSWMMWCMREPARASVSENQLIAAKPAM